MQRIALPGACVARRVQALQGHDGVEHIQRRGGSVGVFQKRQRLRNPVGSHCGLGQRRRNQGRCGRALRQRLAEDVPGML